MAAVMAGSAIDSLLDGGALFLPTSIHLSPETIRWQSKGVASRRKKFGVGTPGTLVVCSISPPRLSSCRRRWQRRFMHHKLEDTKSMFTES